MSQLSSHRFRSAIFGGLAAVLVGCGGGPGSGDGGGLPDDGLAEGGVIDLPRANLDPAQPVPLTYARLVEVVDHRMGGEVPHRFALDYVGKAVRDAFFADLNAACSPMQGDSTPGCFSQAVGRAERALCRAGAAGAFSGGRGSLGRVQGETVLALEGAAAGLRWSVTSMEREDRASWALFAVRELRLATAMYAEAFGCPDLAQAVAERRLARAAERLREAAQSLSSRTQEADALLRLALQERYGQVDDASVARRQATRGLNHSLAEALKLYVAVPAASFDTRQASGHFPILPPALAKGGPADRARVLLVALRLSLEPAAQGPDAFATQLADAALAALRERMPRVFGHLPADAAVLALARFSLTPEDLQDAALQLRQETAFAGIATRPGRHATAGHARWPGLASLGRWAPPGHVYGLTELSAAPVDSTDAAVYASRGSYHALELARRTARQVLARSALPETALAPLSALARDHNAVRGRVRVCPRRGRGLTIDVDDLADPEALLPDTFELWAGAPGLECALLGTLFGEPCDESAERITSEVKDGTARLVVDLVQLPGAARFAAGTRPHWLFLTERGLASASSGGRRVVAVVRPESPSQCGDYPASAELHSRAQALYRFSPSDEIPREVAPPAAPLPWTPFPEDAVPLDFEQALSLRGPTGRATWQPWQPFDPVDRPVRRALEHAGPPLISATSLLRQGSTGPHWAELDPPGCGFRALLDADRSLAQARSLQRVASGEQLAKEAWSLPAASAARDHGLRVIALVAARHALVLAARGLSPDCPDHTGELARQTGKQLVQHSLVAALLATLRDADTLAAALTVPVRAALEQARNKNAASGAAVSSVERRLRRRGLQDSNLSQARLSLALPFTAFEGDSNDGVLDGALSRFPVVTHPALTAEDVHAESLLRAARLHPLLPERSVIHAELDLQKLTAALEPASLVQELRERWRESDPERYASVPGRPAALYAHLGITGDSLRRAAIRLAQLHLAAGLPLAAGPGTPTAGVGLGSPLPAPRAAHLFAVSEGRLSASPDASLWMLAEHSLSHARAFALWQARRAWSGSDLSADDRALVSEFLRAASGRDAVRLWVQPGKAGALVRAQLLHEPDPHTASARYSLWFGEAGLHCALTGRLDGAPCDASEWHVVPQVEARPEGGVNLDFDTAPFAPVSWNPELSRRMQLRAYLIEQSEGQVRALAGLPFPALAEPRPQQWFVPFDLEWASELEDVLGYVPPGERCGTCMPTSACEHTYCQLGLCVREPMPDGTPCGVSLCGAGQCQEAGCGDGYVEHGEGELPAESCDDGNLNDGDGCSAQCTAELRRPDPLVAEGWPSGPAPSLAVDGLGRALLVWTADTLQTDNTEVRAALLDAFGHPKQSVRVELNPKRGYLASPTVTGLRDGGWVIASVTPGEGSVPSVVLQAVGADGSLGRRSFAAPSSAPQASPRITRALGGVAVVWLEAESPPNNELRARLFEADLSPRRLAFTIAKSGADTQLGAPALAHSLEQWLVAFDEWRGVEPLGVRTAAFSASGVAQRQLSYPGPRAEPALATTPDGNYLLAFTDRDRDPAGDIFVAQLPRFEADDLVTNPVAVVASAEAEWRPTLAVTPSGTLVLGYQTLRDMPVARLWVDLAEPGQDLANLSDWLGDNHEGDLSLVSTHQGIWATWSQRETRGRALYGYAFNLQSAVSAVGASE